MGWIAVPTCNPTCSRASVPPVTSSRAASVVDDNNIAALRTVATGAPYAAARPSCTRASSAPCRSSPNTKPRRKPCSALVARREQLTRLLGAGGARSRAGQIGQLREGSVDLDHGQTSVPPPAAAIPAATSSPVRSGVAAGCPRGRRRRSSMSSAVESASTAVINSRLAFRERVALSAAQESASRDSSTRAFSLLRPTSVSGRHQRRRPTFVAEDADGLMSSDEFGCRRMVYER